MNDRVKKLRQESLDALPDDRKPTHLAVIPAWTAYLARTSWFGERLWPSQPTGGGPVGRKFEVRHLSWPGSDPERWPGGDFGNRPRLHGEAVGKKGWVISDAVDVALLPSEASHRYRSSADHRTVTKAAALPMTVVRDLAFASPSSWRGHAVEGGRDVTAEVSFMLAGKPRLPALLVLRSTAIEAVHLTVRVGSWSGALEVPAGESRFSEPALFVPQETVDEGGGRLDVVVEGAGYRAFHWWLLQPEG